jgi:hydroxymethylbilane synthase
MNKTLIRIATRTSPLAMIQANMVRDALHQHHPDCFIELVGLRTEGDQMQARPFEAFTGKGSFVGRLEEALLSGEADCAVHSVKDMPAVLASGLIMPAILQREEVNDVLLGVNHWTQLRPGARVATSSLRRQRQLKVHCPDIHVVPIRGNVDTRLKRLQEGKVDALVLARAGLKRMNRIFQPSCLLPLDDFVPAAGQGALGVECRADDAKMIDMLACLHDEPSALCVHAERFVVRALGAHCHMPLAVYASCRDEQIMIRARLDPKAGDYLVVSVSGLIDESQHVAATVAESMIAQGALDYLNQEQDDED